MHVRVCRCKSNYAKVCMKKKKKKMYCKTCDLYALYVKYYQTISPLQKIKPLKYNRTNNLPGTSISLALHDTEIIHIIYNIPLTKTTYVIFSKKLLSFKQFLPYGLNKL